MMKNSYFEETHEPHKFVSRQAFTLVELLVVIGIIALLISILLPSLNRARQQANSIKCTSNLKQIGTSVQMYLKDSKGYFAPYKNWGKWLANPSDPVTLIDANNALAYWAVAYAAHNGMPRTVFNCPSAGYIDDGVFGSNPQNFDGPWDQGHIYGCYGINGVYADASGVGDAKRTTVFGVPNETALFYRNSAGVWLGKNSARIKNSTEVIFAQDSLEQCVDGNGDTFDSWTQWTAPPQKTDMTHEFLRHNRGCNVLFADTHVDRMTRDDLSNIKFYTGR